MHEIDPQDGERTIDWGRTSCDYAAYRSGPPASFYARLAALGIGVSGQSILDLGTGTGLLARQFARQGCRVCGIDISAGQIEMASRESQAEGLSVEFAAGRADAVPWDDSRFDVATANQCWLYFDGEKTLTELRRVLRPNGRLVTSHFSWLPRIDDIARRSEALVLRHNPDWSAADWSGDVPQIPAWAEGCMKLEAMFVYDEPIHFTRESWRGRFRACRGVGATLSDSEIARFDAEHDQLLRETVPESFIVMHRLDAHVLRFNDEE